MSTGRIKIGMTLRDNDKRNGGRTVVVIDVVKRYAPALGHEAWYALVLHPTRRALIRVDCIRDQGSASKKGWTVVGTEQLLKGGVMVAEDQPSSFSLEPGAVNRVHRGGVLHPTSETAEAGDHSLR